MWKRVMIAKLTEWIPLCDNKLFCSTHTDEVEDAFTSPQQEDELSQVSEFESDNAPSAPPLSPRMYPDLPISDTEKENGGGFLVPATPPTVKRSQSNINMQRVSCQWHNSIGKMNTGSDLFPPLASLPSPTHSSQKHWSRLRPAKWWVKMFWAQLTSNLEACSLLKCFYLICSVTRRSSLERTASSAEVCMF